MRIAAVIANGEAITPAINVGRARITAIEMPAAWTAANLTFQASMDGTNYFDIYDDGGTEVTVTATTSRVMSMRGNLADVLAPWRWIKIRSGTTGVPVNQGAARTLAIYCEAR